MDSLRHPDLVEMAGDLGHVMDAVLGAEQAAAAVAHRRMRTMRDRLLEAEDRGIRVAVHTGIGTHVGRPEVAADHVMVDGVALALHAVVGFQPA